MTTTQTTLRTLIGGLSLATAILSVGCQAPAEAGGEDEVLAASDDKSDGRQVVYQFKRSEAGYRPFNEAQDEWAHGLFNVTPVAGRDGRYQIFGPWYKVTANHDGLWWRVDVREAQGAAKLPELRDRPVAFFVLMRMGAEPWQVITPEVSDEAGKAYAPTAFTSFRAGDGQLVARAPYVATELTSDFYWNDATPEYAFVPAPLGAESTIPGVGQFEISITVEE